MTKKTLIAIDPGASGGIAYILAGSPKPVAEKMPATEGDILDLLATIQEGAEAETVLFMEQVGGFIGKQQPGSRMFTFGRNFGFLLGVGQALKMRIEMVRPQEWQKTLSLGTSNGNKPEWKRKLKSRAQQLYPELKVTLNTADALLILEHAKRRAA